MAKKGKWEMLTEEMAHAVEEFGSISNPTAEECGMCRAYEKVYIRMRALETLEKKLDKA